MSPPTSCYSVSDRFTLLQPLVTVFLIASPFTDLIQSTSLTFVLYSPSFLKNVVIVWLNPVPPAKSCILSAGHTSGHRGHFVLLMLKPCWTAPQSNAGLSVPGTTALHVVFTSCYHCIFKGWIFFFCLSWSCSNFFPKHKMAFCLSGNEIINPFPACVLRGLPECVGCAGACLSFCTVTTSWFEWWAYCWLY